MIGQLKFITVLAIGLGLASRASAVLTKSRGGFEQIERSKNISQLIRSNSNHYWKTMRTEKYVGELAPYLGFEGIIAGDPHLGNFAVVPVVNSRGAREFQFLDIDFDDAGRAPFVLDFTRLVVAMKAVSGEIKVQSLVDAYLQGLTGGSVLTPVPIAEALATSFDSFDRKTDRYVAKRSDGDRFDYQRDDVTRYRGPISRADLEAVFPNQKVLDFARRKKSRGGSAEALRLWVLTEQPDGHRRIFELKQKQASGLSYYQRQAPETDWYNEVAAVFRGNSDRSDYRLVQVGNSKTSWGTFWLREKKIDLITINHNGKSDEARAFAKSLAVYDAWYLGTRHAMQPKASGYVSAIRQNPEAFKNAVKSVAKTYLEQAIEALKGAQ